MMVIYAHNIVMQDNVAHMQKVLVFQLSRNIRLTKIGLFLGQPQFLRVRWNLHSNQILVQSQKHDV
jgi:hypothetical protein